MAQPIESENLIDMDSMTISYKGDSKDINAETFIQSLIHFTSVVNEINKSLDSDKKIEIKIDALSEGSFLAAIKIIATLKEKIGSLFSKTHIEYASKIIEFVGGVFKLKQALKDEKPKSVVTVGDQTTITANSGSTVTVNNAIYHIYDGNPLIRKSLTSEFAALERDQSVSGFELLANDKAPLVQIDRKEFKELGTSTEAVEMPDTRIISKTAILNISKISFDPPMKWDFYYDGVKINGVLITDKTFIESLDKGEQFSKGDQLEVELEIVQEHDKAGDFYKNKSYKVEKIIKHIKPGVQQKLI